MVHMGCHVHVDQHGLSIFADSAPHMYHSACVAHTLHGSSGLGQMQQARVIPLASVVIVATLPLTSTTAAEPSNT